MQLTKQKHKIMLQAIAVFAKCFQSDLLDMLSTDHLILAPA
jgi:hypothetical protein